MEQIIGIFGVPRSGTSWLGQIYNSSPDTRFSYQPMFTERFRDKVYPRSSAEAIEVFVKDMYLSEADFLSQDDYMVKAKKLQFHKESEKPDFFIFKEVMYLYMIPVFLERLERMKVVFIVRNPIDVLTSWYNAPKEFYPEWDIYAEWQFAQKKNMFLPERYYGYCKWKEAMMLAHEMQQRYPERVKFLHYEELSENPIDRTKEVFEFSGFELKEQTRKFIIDSQSRTEQEDPYSVYREKGDKGHIKTALPTEIVDSVKKDLEGFIPYCGWDFLEVYQ